MKRDELLTLAESLLRLPTAPYHEHDVRALVERYCRALDLQVGRDRVGNAVVRYRRGGRDGARPSMPLVFVAHMDHPGFELLDDRHAEFLGGAPKELFAGARVRFYHGGQTTRATLKRVIESVWPHRKLVELTEHVALPRGTFGMWDVPKFRVQRGLLRAATIDDVLGSVVMLATLTEIARRKLPTHVWCVFTRAEEVGFHGAVEVAQAGVIPRGALVVSIEMSKERPWARIGDGPVVRVGDRLSIFDPQATAFLQEAGGHCTLRRSTFRHQRCLMDGGACEATAFAGFGYRVGGVCLPLGNYHNIGKSGKVRAEYVNVNDLEQLVELTTAAAELWPHFGKTTANARARVLAIRRAAPRVLKD